MLSVCLQLIKSGPRVDSSSDENECDDARISTGMHFQFN